MKKKSLICAALAIIMLTVSCSKKETEKVAQIVKESAIEKVTAPNYNEMVLVQGGTFKMGNNVGENEEKPVHDVTVSDFYIGKYEVTVQRWFEYLKELEKKDFDKAKKYTTESVNYATNDSLQIVTIKDIVDSNCQPENIFLYEAVDFCNWLSEKEGLKPCYKIDTNMQDPNYLRENDTQNYLVICDFKANGYRLPTEAEWEFAAKGGNKSRGFKYSGSNNIDDVAWYSGNSGGNSRKKQPVGTKKPNELGIYDMSGNVWEWCYGLFSYDNNYYTACKNLGTVANPTGPTSGNFRVFRGGDLCSGDYECRVTHIGLWPAYGICDFGVRLARTP